MDHQLKVFIEVVESKNFTKAAEKLHMTQPAVSQSIAKLEEKMGVRLIERSNKEFFLNQAGQIVYDNGRRILRNYDQMDSMVRELRTIPSGPIRIGASYTIGEYILPEILVMLHKQYPEILPNVLIGNSDEIGEKLLNHKIDVGFIEGDLIHLAMDKQMVTVDEMYIISSNRTDFQGDVTRENLENQTWIIREEGSGTRKYTEHFFNTYNIKPKKVYILGSTQIIKEAVESGLGISLMSKWVIKKELQLQTVTKLAAFGTPVKRDLSIIKLKQDFVSKAVQRFEEIIKSHIY